MQLLSFSKGGGAQAVSAATPTPSPSASLTTGLGAAWGTRAAESADSTTQVDVDVTLVNTSPSDGGVAFFGADELRSGVSIARFTVVMSKTGTGANMNIGVVDATVAPKYAENGTAVAWALNVYLGVLFTFKNPVATVSYQAMTDCKRLGKAAKDGKIANGILV